jgi:hypothetical protein
MHLVWTVARGAELDVEALATGEESAESAKDARRRRRRAIKDLLRRQDL